MDDKTISFDRAVIQRQIENGDFDLARAGVIGALGISPHSVGLMLTKADLHVACDEFDDAITLLADLSQTPSAVRWAAPRVAEMLNTKPAFFNAAAASEHLSRLVVAVVGAGLPDAEERNFFDAVIRARLDGGIAFLRLVAGHSACPKYRVRLAVALAEAEQVEEAFETLLLMQAAGDATEEAQVILAELHYVRGETEQALGLAKALLAKPELRLLHLGRLIALLRRLGLTDLAIAHTIEALKAGKLDYRLMDHAVRVFMTDEQRAEVVRLLNAIPAAMRPPLVFYTAVAHLFNGEIGTAVKLLEQKLPAAIEGMAGPIRRILARKPVEAWKNDERPAIPFGNDIHARLGEKGRPIVLWVSGLKASLLPQNILDAALQDLGYTVVYFDVHSTVESDRAIRAMLAQHRTGIEECLGTSLANAAMVVGVSTRVGIALEMARILEVPKVLGFGSIVDPETYYSDTKRSLWNPEFLRVLATRYGRNQGIRIVDLLQKTPGVELINYLGSEYGRDVSQAALLDGFDNARSVFIEGIADHLVLNHLYADGKLQAVFRAVADDQATEDQAISAR
ncbi:MAG: hypothetical protein EP335_05690 [Alphaproteobacteria bacterium]|nr:MAG: hypothetical protein EP335_05690 [Alphaproteobacteria bacterium]